MTPPVEEMSPPIPETPSETPDDSPTDTPEGGVGTPEKKRDVSSEQQRRELGYVADTLRNRKIEAALTKQEAGESLSEGEVKLVELHNLGLRKEGDYISEDSEGVVDNSISFTKGKPVFIEVSQGRKLQLLSITGRRTTEDNQSYFECQFKVDEGTTIGRDIPVNEVMKAQYLSEAAVIAQDFTPAEQQLLNLHSDILRTGESVLTSRKTEEVNDLITNIATEQGIITSGDVVKLLEAQADTIPPEQQAQFQQARAALEHMNVMTDASQMTEVLNTLGLNNESLLTEVGKIQQELQQLQEQLAKTPDDDEIKKQVTEKQEALETFQSIQEQVAQGFDFSKYFEHVRTGQVPVEQRKALTEAMRNGDINGMFMNMPEFADDPDDTPEEKAEKELKRKELADKFAKGGLMGLAAILGIMWQVVSIESKELKKSLK
jgi:hypothetical protein